MERMNRKEYGDKRASPDRSGGFVQDQEKQARVGTMKEKIHQVVPPRMNAEQFDIQHMGEPGNGMPVGGIA
jgi:hypothetical protein